jgi:hypothetical protein
MKPIFYNKLKLSISVALLLTAPISGCSSTRKTSTTTVTTAEAPTSIADQPTQRPTAKVITEKTETVTEKDSSGPWCGGILSCTVEGVGWVIALPFRLIGGAIDVVF